MKKLILLTAAFMVAVAVSMQGFAVAAEKSMMMEGYIIDTKCATDNKADLGEFVKTHTKECAVMPACAASGYNLYSEGKLWKFDKGSSDKVHEFLMKKDSTLKVKVEMMHEKDDMIKLVSIKNAK